MILVIDNYDSFVYNIVQYLSEFDTEIHIKRNDQISLDEIEQLKPSYIVLSPGPKTPSSAGICIELIRHFYQDIPTLGICLGHQAIAEAFSWPVIKSRRLMHGKTSTISILSDRSIIHQNFPKKFIATRYHSLTLDDSMFHPDFIITARSDDKTIMGIQHKNFPLFGLQYHPESILTEHGKAHFQNFLTT